MGVVDDLLQIYLLHVLIFDILVDFWTNDEPLSSCNAHLKLCQVMPI